MSTTGTLGLAGWDFTTAPALARSPAPPAVPWNWRPQPWSTVLHVPDELPRLTFAIPYYRGRDYLREAIESVLAQTFTDWELVVVDDCGPEPADGLVRELGDSRITYVRNEVNLGLAGNWNECVRRARAPYVTVLHGDDRLLPDYAAEVVAALDARPEVVATYTDALIIDEAGRPTTTLADQVKQRLPRPKEDHALAGDQALAGLVRGNYIVCPSMCLRRRAVGDAPFDAGLSFVPDWDFTVRVLMEGGTLWGIRQPLIEYRRHGGSQTAILTEDTSRFVEEIEFLERVERDAEARGLRRTAASARRRITVRVHLAVHAALDAVRRRPGAAAKWQLLKSDLRRS